MNLEELLHVLWDARDYIEEYGASEKLDLDMIARIEAQMDAIEAKIWKEKE